jgi:hypothetical protein
MGLAAEPQSAWASVVVSLVELHHASILAHVPGDFFFVCPSPLSQQTPVRGSTKPPNTTKPSKIRDVDFQPTPVHAAGVGDDFVCGLPSVSFSGSRSLD